MKSLFRSGVILIGVGASPVVADSVTPSIPYALSVAVSNSQLSFEIPQVPGKYFYLTDISLTGNGGTNNCTPNGDERHQITFYGMSGYTVGTDSTKYYPLDGFCVPPPSQQFDFHRSFAMPWQAEILGGAVTIVVKALGAGNIAVAGRVIGFYR